MTSADLRRYLNLVLRWAWLLVALPVVAGGVAYAVSLQLPKAYVAEGQILVRPLPAPNTSGPTVPLSNETLATLYTEPPIMQQVVDQLGLSMSAGQVAGEIRVLGGNSQIMHVVVTDTNPQRAADIVNTSMRVFVASTKGEQQQTVGRVLDDLTIVAPASPPAVPVAPRPKRNAGIAALAGFMVALAIIALIEYFDQTIRSDEDLVARSGLQVLGHVPYVRSRKQVRGELDAAGEGNAAEAYRTLRTNLQFASLDQHLKSILITSSISGEGKSRLAANLAAALAGSGRRTLIIDGDLRRPRQHSIFGFVRNVGLSELLIGEVQEDEAIRSVEGVPNLWLLPSGSTPFDPTIMLSSQKAKALLTRLAQGVDHVVIDSPPVTAVADPLILAAEAEVTVVAVEVGRTSRTQLTRTKEALERARASVVGAVVTKVKTGGVGGDYGYGYGYSYRSTEKAAARPPRGRGRLGTFPNKQAGRQGG